MPTQKSKSAAPVDTRTPYQFAEDARRREEGLPPIIRSTAMPSKATAPQATVAVKSKTVVAKKTPSTSRVVTVSVPEHPVSDGHTLLPADVGSDPPVTLDSQGSGKKALADPVEPPEPVTVVHMKPGMVDLLLRGSEQNVRRDDGAAQEEVYRHRWLRKPENSELPAELDIDSLAAKIEQLRGSFIVVLPHIAAGLKGNRALAAATGLTQNTVAGYVADINTALGLKHIKGSNEKRRIVSLAYRRFCEKKDDTLRRSKLTLDGLLCLEEELNDAIDSLENSLETMGLKRRTKSEDQ